MFLSLFHSGWYYFFDSHSHGKNGLSCPTGDSILIGFSNIYDLVTYLYAHYTSMCINLESQFEVLPVSLTFLNKTSNVESQISKYFVDQLKKNNNVTAKIQLNMQNDRMSKCEYMKQYMKKRRMDKTFRNIERQNELTAKRSARSNMLFKQNEALSKRTQKQDETFQQYEASRELKRKRVSRANTLNLEKRTLS